MLAAPAPARTRSVGRSIIPAGHVLFVGAHPDDEIVAAPLLGSICVESGGTCSFLVLTRGEGGSCLLPVCTPDLPSVREREMLRSAALMRATVVQWTLPDRTVDVELAWSAAAGGRDVLVERMATTIASQQPDAVVTLDPEHGTTCHPAHLLTASLVIDAIVLLGPAAPPLFLIETAARLEDGLYRFSPGIEPAIMFDASSTWRYLVEAASAHPSQFTTEQIDALRKTPAEQRKVWISRTPVSGRRLVSCP